MRRVVPLLFIAIATLPSPSEGQSSSLTLQARTASLPFKMEPGPKSPQDSLKCIKVRPGFKVELMVAEPLVMDPIAFAWGPDGKFWVVEMGDYPLGVDGKNKFGGKIKFLEKSKPDGPYDKMTLFMDNVGYPTGVFPYKNGVLVTCAPDIFYAEMGKDGKVTKEVLFTGFREGNQQHRVNGLTWGIDNWIYGANGDSGGVIEGGKLTGLLPRKIMQGKVSISGRDFRFKPDTGEFEAVSGQSQFGRCRDDWGNWFGNNNSNPMFHYVLEDRYLKRNPHVLYPDVRVPVIPGAVRVYPISKPLPRFNTPQALNHFTSACSTIIYRDTLFGKEFEGNAFVSEPVHNLVHRVIVKPKGVTFTSQRADDEKESEFLASSDNWFRPTMIQVGPDGALWIADMYRYVIEHPEWIPKDWQKKLDLRAGHDLGRIYRVYPEGKKPREIPRMDTMKGEDLVKQLEHPNGWVRDTAHQVLVTMSSKRKAAEQVGQQLRDVVWTIKSAQAKLHAIYSWESSGGVTKGTLRSLLKDPHPALRKHAIAILDQFSTGADALDHLEGDGDSQVRLQLAYSLHTPAFGTSHGERLARVLIANANDLYIRAAALSSVSEKNWKDFYSDISKNRELPAVILAPTLRLTKAWGQPIDATRLFLHQITLQEKLSRRETLIAVGDLLDAMAKSDVSLRIILEDFREDEPKKTADRLKAINAMAVEIVKDAKSTQGDKLLAIRLLAQGLGNDRDDHKLLVAMLTPQTPDNEQSAAITQISRQFDPRVPGLLLAPWKTYSPKLRGQVLDTLLSRPLWTSMTLDAIKDKRVPVQEIDAIRRQRLLQHKDAQIREASAKLFAASSNPDRGKVVTLYQLQMPEKGDATRGAKLFAKSCATCHKLGDAGQNVGPDLASVGDKSVVGLLTAILDPNRALEARYVNYAASTKAGKLYNGIIAAETSTSITLVGPDGKSHQLLRNEIDELSSTGQSLMPEGLEKDLNPKEMADLIEYVRSSLPAQKRREFPGNKPTVVHPDKDTIYRLLAKTAAVYGRNIVIEERYQNFGYWYSMEDRVAWTLAVPEAGTYNVWIYYACHPNDAGNTLAIEVGKERALYKVEATESWDDYRGVKIGQVRLEAGKQMLTVRPAGSLSGALADVKKVELSPR